ncbi:hypothetical protein HPP92_023718 [Vanilla planifolia]|uniref:U-box domain-containing protein n=1 Tax=Vanilla planifolia TaxID=51239 RepID=A0A835PL37_VANPL|nr:hypothetical protein HPP92_024060 [Vanilla planifolia]KAG0455930.1 hypothetical protein HPP92_023718 [Vanilla planifolia]
MAFMARRQRILENAARELRIMAKIRKENRKLIAEEGGIPLLCHLLHSKNGKAQENAVTALLNLSIQYENKRRIMEEARCLSSIVEVLRRGLTAEVRENAAAALFSLSAVHDYKKKIVEEAGGLEGLAELLRKGRPRERKDAAMALFNLATHPESWRRMVDSGAMRALLGALEDDDVAEEVAGAVEMLAREPVVAGMVGLAGIMRAGSSRGRENAAAALHEICRSGGKVMAERVARSGWYRQWLWQGPRGQGGRRLRSR